MAAPTNTLQSFTMVNKREDLSKLVYRVDPYKTPVMSIAKREKSTAVFHEWVTDSLAAQNTSNLQIQGDDSTGTALSPTARIGNYSGISRKEIILSGTSQAIKAAGDTNSFGYQMTKAAEEIKRDMEGIITNNVAKSPGNATTAAIPGGLPAYITVNTIKGASGADPTGVQTTGPDSFGDGSTARTDGTAAAITEANFKTLGQKIFTACGDVGGYFFCSPTNKVNISAFTGTAGTRFNQVEDKALRTTISVYETDWGDVKVIPDIFLARSKDCFWLDPEYIAISYLRPFETVPLAKTGDADKKMIIVEYTPVVRNERAIGGYFDTTG